MAGADSIAIDPHKWFYTPLQAGCVLVRDMAHLRDTFSYHPPYYPEKDEAVDAPLMYHEYGPENSRGFRALKVWLAFRQVGRDGFVTMIRDDIAMARRLFDRVSDHPEFEGVTQDLSIATFRYVPSDVDASDPATSEYLNTLNARIHDQLQESGTTYLSNAVIDEAYLLRACVVNFRTSAEGIDRRLHRLPGLGLLGDIAAQMGRPAPLCADGLGGGPGGVLVPIGDQHRGAVFGEQPRRGLPDARAAPGDQCGREQHRHVAQCGAGRIALPADPRVAE